MMIGKKIFYDSFEINHQVAMVLMGDRLLVLNDFPRLPSGFNLNLVDKLQLSADKEK